MNRLTTAACVAALALTTAPAFAAPASADTTASTGTTGRVVKAEQAAFVSPSGNISCVMSRGSVRCETDSRAWKLPKKPASCRYDWGQGLTLGSRRKDGRGALLCASDTIRDAPVLGHSDRVSWFRPSRDVVVRRDGNRLAGLPYGSSIRVGSMTCTSAKKGVTCTNTVGHGIFLSKKAYRTW